MVNSTGGDQIAETVIDAIAGVARIPLFRRDGSRLWAVVDFVDLETVRQYRWYAFRTSTGGTAYAHANFVSEGKKRAVAMHRLLLDAPAGLSVDHQNGNGLDNRRSNLRLATKSQNAANRVNRSVHATRYRGARWLATSKGWAAYITVDRKPSYLGTYDDELSAAMAYDDAARAHFGEFARTNFSLAEASTIPRTPRRPRAVKHGLARAQRQGCHCAACSSALRAHLAAVESRSVA